MQGLDLGDARHVTIAGGSRLGCAQNAPGFSWSQQITHEVSKLGDADHLIGADVVGFAILTLQL